MKKKGYTPFDHTKGPYPLSHSIDGEKMPPEGTKQPKHDGDSGMIAKIKNWLLEDTENATIEEQLAASVEEHAKLDEELDSQINSALYGPMQTKIDELTKETEALEAQREAAIQELADIATLRTDKQIGRAHV